ncbi:MAG TPA: hypothetical protein VE224_02140 [Pseudolabrys sp.]|nr:hypothetical protein [Pseudolabrys sp.]
MSVAETERESQAALAGQRGAPAALADQAATAMSAKSVLSAAWRRLCRLTRRQWLLVGQAIFTLGWAMALACGFGYAPVIPLWVPMGVIVCGVLFIPLATGEAQ